MMRAKSKKLFGGFTAILAMLLSLSIGLSSLAVQWESLVNAYLGISVENTVVGGDDSIDTVYFKSSFGDISAMYKANPSNEEIKALADAQTALIAAEKAFAIREQEEGSVLLKNDLVDGEPALPLQSDERSLTLFGRASAPALSLETGGTVFRSTSAGSAPNGAKQLITYAAALREAGFTLNEEVLAALESSDVKRVRGKGNGESTIGEVSVSFYDPYKSTFDTDGVAIVMFSRMAGEGFDLNVRDSSGISQLALHEEEADLLEMVASCNFKKTIVLINSAYPMELGWLTEEKYGVDACLWIGEPSMYGFAGVANILTGKANPSGRLVDTYATNSLSSPAVQNFGDNSFSNNSEYKYVVEAEGIYIGYKYYETRYEDVILNAGNAASTKGSSSGGAWSYADEVVFPFGYGLSYTTFSQTLDSVEYDAQKDVYNVSVTVTNTGDVAGKYSVLVYAQTPYNAEDGIEKSAIQLVGFNKAYGTLENGEKETPELTSRESGMLAPGESETVVVEVERYHLASYSTAARNGAGGYVLTQGNYYFAIGENAHDALNNVLAAKNAKGMVDENGTEVTGDVTKVVLLDNIGVAYDEDTYSKSRYTDVTVENQLENADINYWVDGTVTYLSRSDWDATFPSPVVLSLSDEMKKEMDAGVYKAPSDAPAKGTYTQGQINNIDLIDMKGIPFTGTYVDKDGVEQNADELWEKFLDQLTVEELIANTTENTQETASSVNAPYVLANDGPDGVGGTMENGWQTTAYPSEIVAASTFNPKTMRLRGYFQAEDGIFTKTSFLIGPGGNLHRTPFSGRNFEYYSEDALLGYKFAYYQTVELQAKGMVPMIKHYVGNNQETNRQKVATFNNEQAWREGSLKVFEGSIAKADGLGVMTSYSLIGCTAATSHRGSNIDVMQNEWGFVGINITDASMGQTYMDSVDSIINGTTMFCLDNREADLKRVNGRSSYDDILVALRRANKQYYYSVLRTNAINGIAPGVKVVTQNVWWKTALAVLQLTFAVLTVSNVAMYVYFGYVKKEQGGH